MKDSTKQGDRNAEVRSDPVEPLLQSLTLREKIGQTVQVCLTRQILDGRLEDYFAEYPVGSVFTGGEIIKQADEKSDGIRALLARCNDANSFPLLVAGDLESGAGAAVADKTRFPTLLALGSTDDESLAYEYGKYTALEGRSAGFNWTFSPVVDLMLNWLNPIVSNRGLGDDPERVLALANAIIAGLQDHGIAACAKHFPGDGVDFRDQHLITSTNSLSEERWWQLYGKVFQSVIDQGAMTVMSGHIALPWMDPVRSSSGRPRPASVSAPILTELLRNKLGFEGVVVSDALIMAGYVGWSKHDERLIEAFAAGNDVMLWPDKRYYGLMEQAIDDGRLSMDRLDTSVRRILRLKQKLGLLGDHCAWRDDSVKGDQYSSEAVDLSRRVAEKSITLVRNRKQLLPLDCQQVKRLLLHVAIPPGVNDWYIDLLVSLIEARGIEVTQHRNGNCLEVYNMEEAGHSWDAYVVVYSLQNHKIKNTVRPVAELGEVMWAQQYTELLEPIAISLNTPYLLFDNPYMDTLINAYSFSAETISALDRALFGEIRFNEHSPVNLEVIP